MGTSLPAVPEASSVPAVPSNSDDPSLTDWFQSIPFPVVGRDNPATANSTRVLERGGPGALAGFGWPHGAPVTEDDTPLLERGEAAGMLRRNRTRLMWALALGTALAMLITGVLVAVFGVHPAPHAGKAAAGHPSAVRTLSPKASPSPPSTPPRPPPTTGTPVSRPGLRPVLRARWPRPGRRAARAPMNNAVFSLDGRGERGGRDTVPRRAAPPGTPAPVPACSASSTPTPASPTCPRRR